MEQPDLDRVNEGGRADGASRTRSVPVLQRALAVLEILSTSHSGLTLPEVARRLKLPKSSAHTILITLAREGYLARSPMTRRYTLTTKFVSLANHAIEGLRIREVALPHLRQLMASTNLTVHMAILEHYDAILIAKMDPPGAGSLSTWIGRRMEVHCTGVGKALIATLPEAEREEFLRSRVFARHNDNTVVSPRLLRQQMEAVRKLGYSVDDEEDEVGFRCLGAPIPAGDGEYLNAAISIAGTVLSVNDDNKAELAAKLLRTAEQIGEAMREEDSKRV
jgi:DNA-binding IclR family transcriptional regulator